MLHKQFLLSDIIQCLLLSLFCLLSVGDSTSAAVTLRTCVREMALFFFFFLAFVVSRDNGFTKAFNKVLVGWFTVFYDMSTLVGNLMPNLVYTYIKFI